MKIAEVEDPIDNMFRLVLWHSLFRVTACHRILRAVIFLRL